MTDQELELELNEVGTRLGDPRLGRRLVWGFSMEHSDVDVKVAAASCVSEITRITAPDALFEDEQMRDLAKELLDTFTARQMGKVFLTNSGSEANDSQQHNYQDLEMEYEASKAAFSYSTTTGTLSHSGGYTGTYGCCTLNLSRLLREVEPDLMDALIRAMKDGDHSKLQTISNTYWIMEDDDEELDNAESEAEPARWLDLIGVTACYPAVRSRINFAAKISWDLRWSILSSGPDAYLKYQYGPCYFLNAYEETSKRL
ncbi:hypothetical protein Syun_003241 [Stephania yunnanensis]|uniref:Uncharacterized protein n=1 Tax=Stephania yunnanensis TaxID=152371 RepID=A0AAP0Q1G0_9MAGN